MHKSTVVPRDSATKGKHAEARRLLVITRLANGLCTHKGNLTKDALLNENQILNAILRNLLLLPSMNNSHVSTTGSLDDTLTADASRLNKNKIKIDSSVFPPQQKEGPVCVRANLSKQRFSTFLTSGHFREPRKSRNTRQPTTRQHPLFFYRRQTPNRRLDDKNMPTKPSTSQNQTGLITPAPDHVFILLSWFPSSAPPAHSSTSAS